MGGGWRGGDGGRRGRSGGRAQDQPGHEDQQAADCRHEDERAQDGAVAGAQLGDGETVVVGDPNVRAVGGKIFRMSPDGTVTQFARGFRNPFDMAWDPEHRRLIVGDNGTQQVFKFAERVVPASLKKYRFDKFDVFGISRYGETTPVTEAEITALGDIDS